MSRPSDREPRLLGEHSWLLDDLAARHPPQWANSNKRAIASVATPPGASHEGRLLVSRWAGGELPDALSDCDVDSREGFFIYAPVAEEDERVHWHMNFADPYLFGYGEGPLMAQDELQITEHPCLASLGRAIESREHDQEGLTRYTREGGMATPVLVQGAPRRCVVDTTHLYGDNFACAPEHVVLDATTRVDPPTLSNIIALAALSPESGAYTSGQVQGLLQTAYTGFRALVLRSEHVTLHTGYWGCGAFGGNKGLVAAVQLLAAGAAEVERVCFWWGRTELDRSALEHAIAVQQHLNGASVDEAVAKLVAAGYRWGLANENHVPYEPPENCMLGK
ncbi:MAG TPA: hypothetical protein EYQ74_11410 [Planctomycetes bacterium]|nr:hypothetical protein [Planctomycetota bacterium]HIK61815.1 hypothetical protein [Planctomycetota bacterium]